MQVQDLRGAGLRALQGAVQNLADEGNADPRLVGLFSSFSVDQPQLFVEIDREKLKSQKVSLDDVNRTLQAYLGSMYVNDFTQFNRNWQVNVQAEPRSRSAPRRHRPARSPQRRPANSVPLSTLINVKNDSGPAVVNRYNSYPSAEVNGNPAAGVSSGQATEVMNDLSREWLPASMGSEWTEITLQQIIASQDVLTKLAFPLAVVFVFLVLSAQYESWSLPMSIILIVPMCLLASIGGIWLVGMDNNIFTQIGLVVLIGLAAKNAILIVEFAKQRQDQGLPRDRSDDRGLPPASAADSHDVVRLHPGRGAAGAGQGRRGRNAHRPGRRRLQRHARRDHLRPVLHPRVLLRHHAVLLWKEVKKNMNERHLPAIQRTCAAMLLFAICIAQSFAAEPAASNSKSFTGTPRAAALAELQDYSLEGMSRRLGPTYDSYHKQSKPETFPEIWMAPVKTGPDGRHWEIGGPWTKEAGDFSSTQGQVLYVPDKGVFPVDRVTIEEWSNGCFTESPEAPWHGGFRPEPASVKWKQAVPGGDVGIPIAMARGMGYWANNGLAIFSSGLVAAAGTVTARGEEPTFLFPRSKLPLAISITNKSEFALVTVHDLERHVGQVAVFSLGVNGKKNNFVHEWQDAAWSLPNVAMLEGIKLLGYVDLPGLEFPTGVCAVGNKLGGRMNGRDGNAGVLREYDLAKQADRDVFNTGNNADFSSTAGFAVVIGKYENKAAFLDLRPLFAGSRIANFTTEANYQKTRDSGLGPKQWPYTFEVEPRWKPTVVKTIGVPHPTAVIASMTGGPAARALIASLDGTVGIYTVGGLTGDGPATAAGIGKVGAVRVGRNPVCLAYQKYSNDTVIAVSRGDRELSWIKYTDSQPQVIRRLRDARMLDPVFTEVSDTHGIETSLLTVADFTGRKIINYRYSRVVFATQGGAKFDLGPDGKDEYECGGVMELPGSPLSISATNVN